MAGGIAEERARSGAGDRRPGRGAGKAEAPGVRRDFYFAAVAPWLDLVLEIDVQGAAQVKQKLPESVAIFILPPSRQELERRLRDRGQDSDEEIARRLAKARDEIAQFGKYYDLCVANEDVERAGREVQAIVLGLRWTSVRRRARVEQLLASFGRE